MRRILIVGVLTGVGFLIVRVIAPKLKLHERLMARCEAMFEQMPDSFPPKRMMEGVEELRGNTARIVELLEARTNEADERAVATSAPDLPANSR